MNRERDTTCKGGKVHELLERPLGGWIQRTSYGSIQKNGKVQTQTVELTDESRE